jgi:DNA-binding transcriptional ArsR family regulator
MKIEKLHREAGNATTLLKVLANESRLQILCHLVHGEKSVTALEQAVGLRQSAISQHLAIMRRERIVKTRREAQQIFYKLASPEARAIRETLYQLYCAKTPGKK